MGSSPVSRPLIEVDNLHKHYAVRDGARAMLRRDAPRVRAVDGVTFVIPQGATVGLAGESGCGKTTTARLLLRLDAPSEGIIRFAGRDLASLRGQELQQFRRKAQLMFQNPFEALNPRFTVLQSIMEPLVIHQIGTRQEREHLALEMMEKVNLRPASSYANRYPTHLSGGQLQRVVLARALILQPEFLVADEPVSMLDVSVRAGVLRLMQELSASLNLTTLYISHDLSLIQYMCDFTGVMYLGKLVEWGPTLSVINNPQHPYTKALIAAVPSPNPDVRVPALEIGATPPNPLHLPSGCRFHDRCPFVEDICRQVEPAITTVAPGHEVSCHLVEAENGSISQQI